MDFPSWHDVAMPLTLIESVKRLPPCYFLDSLVHQLVMGNKRKPQYTYTCDTCGCSHRPEKATDEVVHCPECDGQQMRCAASWRFTKEIQPFSRSSYVSLAKLISSMRGNFICYFGEMPKYMNCGWDVSGGLYCQFQGGELVCDTTPRLCIVKAAILCPYLWNNSFNDKTDTIHGEHLAPILHNYCRIHE